MKYVKHITLGVDPKTGKRIRKRIYADTPAQLRKKEKDAQRLFDKRGNPANTTLEQYIEKWREAYISMKSYASQRAFDSAMAHLSNLKYRRMCDITRLDLQAVIKDNWNHPYACKSLSYRLNSIWQSAVIDGTVEKNVAVGLDIPRTVKKEKRPLTTKELEAIAKADFTSQERLLVDILLQFGLRPAEALALDSSSVQGRELVINKALAHASQSPIIKRTKTGITRSLPIPDAFISRLKPSEESNYLFTNKGALFSRWEVQKISKSILRKINEAMGGNSKLKMTDMTLYTFRHNKASLLYYMDGVSLKAKARYMGHSEEVFIRTYSHMIEEKENIERLRESVV